MIVGGVVGCELAVANELAVDNLWLPILDLSFAHHHNLGTLIL